MNIIELVKDILQQFPKISEVCNDIHIDACGQAQFRYCSDLQAGTGLCFDRRENQGG